MMEWYWSLLGAIGWGACGFIAGREWRKKKLEETLRKEIYEQGKLDGAFEYARNTFFSAISKR